MRKAIGGGSAAIGIRGMAHLALACGLAALLGPASARATGAEDPEAPSGATEGDAARPASAHAPPADPPPAYSVPLSLGPDPLQTEEPWRPPPHMPDEKDRLRLVSGESLQGEIEHIAADTVHFDSDELGDLEVDWDAVASLRSPKRNTYRFTGRVVVTGTAGMRDGVMRIDTGTEIREFRQLELFGMIRGSPHELNYWSLDAGAGLTLRSGNSDQSDLSSRIQVARETPITKALVSYQTAYSVVEGEEITNNHRLAGQFSVYFSRRFFALAPVAEAFRDRLQNIGLRTTVGLGVGYDILDRPRSEWSVTLGGAYQKTRFDAAEPGESRRDDDAALLVRSMLELDPHSDLEWDTQYRLSLVVTDLDKTNHHLDSVLSFDLLGPLDLDVSFLWDRIEGPQPDSRGEVPEQDDFRLTVGLAIDL